MIARRLYFYIVLATAVLNGCGPSDDYSEPSKLPVDYSKSSKSEITIFDEGTLHLMCERSLVGHSTEAHLVWSRAEKFGQTVCRNDTLPIEIDIKLIARSQGTDTLQVESSFDCEDKDEASLAIGAAEICSEMFSKNSIYGEVAP